MNAQTKWNGSIFTWAAISRDLIDNFKTRFNNPDTARTQSPIPNPQSPILNPQSPIPNPNS
jgi:hypothetical protein